MTAAAPIETRAVAAAMPRRRHALVYHVIPEALEVMQRRANQEPD
jgi:hypothetical protein